MSQEEANDTRTVEIARLRRELARERALLRAVLDNMDEGVVVSDAGFKVVAYNQRFVDYYAVPPEVTKAADPQREMARFMVARGALDVQAAFRTWREGSQGAIFEVTRSDGRVLEVHSNPLPEGGFVSTYVDVTDRKRAQAELVRMRQFAEAANDAKSRFLAAMSHEIRTPMNGVLAMLELLHDTGLDADQDSMVEIVRESASSLMKIIDDILDFSKIEAGKLDLERIELPLRTIVESVVETLAPQARRKGLELSSLVDPRVPATVLGDPVRLRQILFNLVGNAIKFTELGEVAVAVEPTDGAAGTLRFAVRDTGIGLGAEAIGRLFQPFSQADTSTTRRFGGTGLGLSISTRLVELMGGRLAVESEPGQGSTFSFAVVLPPGNAVSAGPMLQGRRVAVVEPRASSRRVFETYLVAAGASVTCVDDPRAALDLIERAADTGAPFHAAIIDFGLGAIDGVVLGETIRGTPSLFDTRLVLTSAADLAGLRKKALERGIDAYLLKPVRRDMLLRAVLGEAADAAPRAASAVQAGAGGLVLVAEDNPTNRAVVMRQLAKLGYGHEVVADGRAAFARWQQGGLDAILTDCHMPDWDGFELVRRIRAAEQESGAARTPVVALSANALAGEAERCLAAGMDDFVAKPATLAALGGALANVLGRSVAHAADDEPAGGPGGGDVDFAALKQLYGGDSEDLRQVIGLYFENGARLVDDMEAAAAARDAEAGADAAHALKGASRTIGALGVGDAAGTVETAFFAGDWAAAAAGLGPVRTRFEAARANLLMALSPAGGALR